MAWNPSPEVAVARDAAAKLNAKQAIIVYFTDDDKVGMSSYGRTKKLCAAAGVIGEMLFNLIQNGQTSVEKDLFEMRAKCKDLLFNNELLRASRHCNADRATRLLEENKILVAENQMLRDNLLSMGNRIADQSELLSKKAEKK